MRALLKGNARRVGRATALMLALLLSFAGVAVAKTWTVTTTADSSFGSCTVAGCSLRDAVAAANADTGDTIVIPANSNHYLLNNELHHFVDDDSGRRRELIGDRRPGQEPRVRDRSREQRHSHVQRDHDHGGQCDRGP